MWESVQFDVSVDVDTTGQVIVKAAGELDVVVARQLTGLLERTIRAPGTAHVCVDLKEVTFLDAAGITALVRSHKLAHALCRGFSVRDARGGVRNVLRLTGVAELLAEPQAVDLRENAPERAPR